MKQFRFAEVSNEKFEALKKLEIGRSFISAEQMFKVEDILELGKYTDIEELRAIRNTVVKTLSDEMDVFHEAHQYDELDKLMATMSGTVHVIDGKMWDLGADM